ncbi:hypothetical protein ACVWZK_008571 [Bradyrhizobium sp. GM0.4]
MLRSEVGLSDALRRTFFSTITPAYKSPAVLEALSGLSSLFGLKAGDDLFSGSDASETTVRRLQDQGGLQR